MFYYLYWENDTSLASESRNFLVTSSKVRRTFKPNRKGQRSKYVVRPETVALAGNHVIWKFIPGKQKIGHFVFHASTLAYQS